jgi:hypothetical protein
LYPSIVVDKADQGDMPPSRNQNQSFWLICYKMKLKFNVDLFSQHILCIDACTYVHGPKNQAKGGDRVKGRKTTKVYIPMMSEIFYPFSNDK